MIHCKYYELLMLGIFYIFIPVHRHMSIYTATTMHCNNGEAPGKARASAAAGVSIGNDRKGKKSRPDTQPQQRTGDEQATALCTLHQV